MDCKYAVQSENRDATHDIEQQGRVDEKKRKMDARKEIAQLGATNEIQVKRREREGSG